MGAYPFKSLNSGRDARRRISELQASEIAGAISEYLGKTGSLTEFYLRGTKSETILFAGTNCLCAGVAQIPDGIAIPPSLEARLLERLAKLPDEP